MKKILFLLTFSILLAGCEDFFEEDISNENVRIIAPVNGVAVEAGEINFLWKEVKGATAYHITIVSPNFAEAGTVVADEILTNDSITRYRSYSCEIGPGDYQWSLAAMNSAYLTQATIFSLQVMTQNEDNKEVKDKNPVNDKNCDLDK